MQADLKTLEKTRLEKTNLSYEEMALLDAAIEGVQARIQQMPSVRLDRRFVRLIATLWVGQVAYERGDYADAAAYFRYLLDAEVPALEKSLQAIPEKPTADADKRLRQYADEMVKPMLAVWKAGANYNLARALEAGGRHAEAIEAYMKDSSVQLPGSRYRAAARATTGAEPAEAKKKPDDSKAAAKPPSSATGSKP